MQFVRITRAISVEQRKCKLCKYSMQLQIKEDRNDIAQIFLSESQALPLNALLKSD